MQEDLRDSGFKQHSRREIQKNANAKWKSETQNYVQIPWQVGDWLLFFFFFKAGLDGSHAICKVWMQLSVILPVAKYCIEYAADYGIEYAAECYSN